MFRHRQQLRQWAARVLLLWLFGLGASLANACLIAGPVELVGPTVSHHLAAVEAHHGVVLHGHGHGINEALPAHSAEAATHHGSFAKANCQDFCEKARVSISPLKSALDDVQFHAAITTTAMTVLPMPAYAPVRLWVPRRDGVQAPPIHIAFLRLAL